MLKGTYVKHIPANIFLKVTAVTELCHSDFSFKCTVNCVPKHLFFT